MKRADEDTATSPPSSTAVQFAQLVTSCCSRLTFLLTIIHFCTQGMCMCEVSSCVIICELVSECWGEKDMNAKRIQLL